MPVRVRPQAPYQPLTGTGGRESLLLVLRWLIAAALAGRGLIVGRIVVADLITNRLVTASLVGRGSLRTGPVAGSLIPGYVLDLLADGLVSRGLVTGGPVAGLIGGLRVHGNQRTLQHACRSATQESGIVRK